MKPVFLSVLLLFTLPLIYASEAPRPNILYFYVDDMGWGSIGPNGQSDRRARNLPSVKTPNLDQLAAEGVNFTRAYGCTVCSPARSSQQTGFHQGHTFADRNDPDNAKKAMRADDVLMGDALSAAGYVTGYWGKWGFGGSKDQRNPTLDNIQTLPTSHGYRFVLAELHHVRAHTFFQPTLWSAPAPPNARGGLELIPNSLAKYRGDSRYPDQPSNHEHPDYPATSYCDDLYALAALDFVRTQGQNYRETGRPFFGLLAVQIPHAPFKEITTLPGWDSAYQDDPHFASLADQSKQWAAMVTRIDAHFGNILAALDDPDGDGDDSDSIARKTLVIFMSDNGGPGGPTIREFDANGGLRGTKGGIHEGGIRVPMILRWPDRITDQSELRAGTSSDRVIDVTDLLPTFCELAGVDAPVGLDGVSLAPTLTGEGEQRKREFLIHEAGKAASIIRGRHKLIRTGSGVKLFDLEADLSESDEISKAHPELVQRLETLLTGERVDQPKGFANTYHHWTGGDGADASLAENWSDYRYENEGITYLTDDGPPRLSWTAVMENTGKDAATAKTRSDLAFLGLEIGGASASQTLVMESGANLTGRNEIRLSKGGGLDLRGGKISSLRWVDVREGGFVRGTGEVDATVYNAGKVSLAGSPLRIRGDYVETPATRLEVQLGGELLRVDGIAKLAGKLSVTMKEDFSPEKIITVISAKKIIGKFSNENNTVIAEDGSCFDILYTRDEVQLRPHPWKTRGT